MACGVKGERGWYPAFGRAVTAVFIIPLGIMWLVRCALQCGARLGPVSENSYGKRTENWFTGGVGVRLRQ